MKLYGVCTMKRKQTKPKQKPTKPNQKMKNSYGKTTKKNSSRK